MYECYCCHTDNLVLDSDGDFSDYGLEGVGVVYMCHCTHCGACYEIYCPNDVDGEEDD